MFRLSTNQGVDLHVHTNVAGGRWEPDHLVKHIAESGIGVIAATDHDTVVNVKAVVELAKQMGVQAIPGLELTTGFEGILWHVLLYGIQPDDPALLGLLREAIELEDGNAGRLRQALEAKGYHLSWLAARPRPHSLVDVATSLARDGYATGLFDGFKLIQKIEMTHELIDLARATTVAHQQGAIAILAHPGRTVDGILREADPERVKRMATVGLDGVEAFYPTHRAEQINSFVSLASRCGMLVSCGSDSHGIDWPTSPIAWSPLLCRDLLQHFNIEVDTELEQNPIAYANEQR